MKKINTAVIIVNWNGKKFLSNCFNSLKNQTYQNFKIVFVDNGSVDGSVKYVQKKFILSEQNRPKQIPIEIIKLSENTGFAKGNNIGISQALGDKNIQNVVLLNNDTKVEKDFLEKLVGAVSDKNLNKKYKKIGALAPKILLWKKLRGPASQKTTSQKIIDAMGARVGLDGRGYNIGHEEVDEGQYDKSGEVFGFCGGAVLLRREMLENVVYRKKNDKKDLIRWFDHRIPGSRTTGSVTGHIVYSIRNGPMKIKYQQYFDDNFFAYYEDTDLSWRMRLRGWQSVTVPKAVVWHIHSGTASPFSFFKAYYLNRNRFLMMLKNYPLELLCKGLLLVPKSYFNLAKTSKGKKYIYGDKIKPRKARKIRMIGVLSKAVCSISWNLPKIIKQRHNIQKNKLVSNRSLRKWLE